MESFASNIQLEKKCSAKNEKNVGENRFPQINTIALIKSNT